VPGVGSWWDWVLVKFCPICFQCVCACNEFSLDVWVRLFTTEHYRISTEHLKIILNLIKNVNLLCKSDSEDRIHLVLHCTTYTHIWDKHLNTLQLLMSENFDRCIVDKIMNDTEILMQCLMDSSDGFKYMNVIYEDSTDFFDISSYISLLFPRMIVTNPSELSIRHCMRISVSFI
jgi:hypothetical protein